METKNIWVVVGVSAIVAVIATLIVLSVAGQISLSPASGTILVKPVVGQKTEVYTKNGVDSKFTTNQKVLDMLRAYDLGNCGFVPIPDYEDLDEPHGIAYRQADSNQDGVTTGIELAESLDSTCLFGFIVERASTPEGIDYITSPIGCAGGPTLSDLQEMKFPQTEEYLICSA